MISFPVVLHTLPVLFSILGLKDSPRTGNSIGLFADYLEERIAFHVFAGSFMRSLYDFTVGKQLMHLLS